MILIQQSSSFRAWTSRALMVYFRRALLFLVVSPRQNINSKYRVLQKQQQQQHTICFSDAEDDEEILIINENKTNSNQIEINQLKHNLLKEYIFNKFSQELNNSTIIKSIQKETINSLSTEPFELSTYNSISIKTLNNNTKIHKNKISNNSIYQTNCTCSLWQQTPINNYNQIYPSCQPSISICNSFDDETLSSSQYSSISIEQNLSQSSDNNYEKYQTSFSYILHQTKSLHTIRKEDKLQSMLVLEPNTTIITVYQLTYNSLKPIITNHICVRLIANQTDLSIQSNKKSIGCKKSFTCIPIKYNNIININNKKEQQQSLISSYKNFETSSILIDIPSQLLYIDS